MVINSLIDNELDTISKLGELSYQSRSYSREIGVYTNDNYDKVRLMTFYSFNDKTEVPLSKELANHVLALGQWLTDEALLNRIDADRTAFIQKLNEEYKGRITLKQAGKMVTNGKYYLPEYITFSLTADTRENTYRIWFSDDAFRGQYDKYEIEVIPQIINVDDYHKGYTKVSQVLTEHTVKKLHDRVNEKANGHPYTYIVTNIYDYINPDDKTMTLPTSWTVIIYGEHGNNSDIIREAISNHVLANSDYTREQWEKIIPDLFIPTEFYLCPFWTKFATENLQLKGGIYSPTVPLRDVIPFAQRTMVGYAKTHLEKNVAVLSSTYKSIALLACGHAKNRLTSSKFEEAWADYCNIYSTSRDFNRISPETQEFILVMNKLLLETETMTPDSEVPLSYSRVKRGEMYYLSKEHNGVSYLMPLRWNFLKEINVSSNIISIPAVNNTGTQTAETNARVTDVINMTPDVIAEIRGRTVSELTSTVNNGEVTTANNKPATSGTSGTPVDATDGTPAANESGNLTGGR